MIVMRKRKQWVPAAAAVFAGCMAVAVMPDEERGSDSFWEQNIEALAQDRGGSAQSWDCWKKLKRSPGSAVWKCGNPCVFVRDSTGSGRSDKCYAYREAGKKGGYMPGMTKK